MKDQKLEPWYIGEYTADAVSVQLNKLTTAEETKKISSLWFEQLAYIFKQGWVFWRQVSVGKMGLRPWFLGGYVFNIDFKISSRNGF